MVVVQATDFQPSAPKGRSAPTWAGATFGAGRWQVLPVCPFWSDPLGSQKEMIFGAIGSNCSVEVELHPAKFSWRKEVNPTSTPTGSWIRSRKVLQFQVCWGGGGGGALLTDNVQGFAVRPKESKNGRHGRARSSSCCSAFWCNVSRRNDFNIFEKPEHLIRRCPVSTCCWKTPSADEPRESHSWPTCPSPPDAFPPPIRQRLKLSKKWSKFHFFSEKRKQKC